MRIQGVLLYLILSLVSGENAAFATSFAERPFAETVRESAVIVRGIVGPKSSDWSKDGGPRRIYTYYELKVDEVLKGATTGQVISIREIGGQKDGMAMEVAGAASFTAGDEVVVLLDERSPSGAYPIHGMMMGRLSLVRDETGKEFIEGPALDRGESRRPLEYLQDLIDQSPAAPQSVRSSDRPDPRSHATAPRLQPSPQSSEEEQRSEDTNSTGLAIAIVISAIMVAGLTVRTLRKRRSR